MFFGIRVVHVCLQSLSSWSSSTTSMLVCGPSAIRMPIFTCYVHCTDCVHLPQSTKRGHRRLWDRWIMCAVRVVCSGDSSQCYGKWFAAFDLSIVGRQSKRMSWLMSLACRHAYFGCFFLFGYIFFVHSLNEKINDGLMDSYCTFVGRIFFIFFSQWTLWHQHWLIANFNAIETLFSVAQMACAAATRA